MSRNMPGPAGPGMAIVTTLKTLIVDPLGNSDVLPCLQTYSQ